MGFLEDLLLGVGRLLSIVTIRRLKIHAVMHYVRMVAAARGAYIGSIAASLLLLIFACGLVVLHVGLFLVLPWSLEMRGLLFLILGAVYLIVPLALILGTMSERLWMKRTGAAELVAKVTER